MAELHVARAVAGGALVGLGLLLLLLASGRVVGVSGVVAGLLRRPDGDFGWRIAFLAGLLAGGLLLAFLTPGALAYGLDRSWVALACAGALVGYGTTLGNGCTSGHGVCGVGRLSPRSMVATGVFIATGAITVLVVRTVAGGRL
jgi:uncharacterized membrane protein YedE/YeeE